MSYSMTESAGLHGALCELGCAWLGKISADAHANSSPMNPNLRTCIEENRHNAATPAVHNTSIKAKHC